MTPEAFDRLVREHQRMVYSIALTYCRNSADADDVAQEAFIRAHRSINGLADPTRLKTWLYTLTRNAAIDHLRRVKRQRALLPLPRDERSGNDRIDRLLTVVDSLQEDYQRLILLRYVEGLSYKEIAEVLDMQVSAVGEKLSRVRQLIAERMGGQP